MVRPRCSGPAIGPGEFAPDHHVGRRPGGEAVTSSSAETGPCSQRISLRRSCRALLPAGGGAPQDRRRPE